MLWMADEGDRWSIARGDVVNTLALAAMIVGPGGGVRRKGKKKIKTVDVLYMYLLYVVGT
jgi:hypothetical protein